MLTRRQVTSFFGEIFGMGKLVVAMCCTLGFAGTFFGMASAGETGHYVNGVEGIKASTLPPPGFYYRMYNVYYDADEIMDEDGDALDVGLDVHVYALVNRFVWISDIKMLGADFGADVIIPLVYTDLEIKAFDVDDDEFGLGELLLNHLFYPGTEPVMMRHSAWPSTFQPGKQLNPLRRAKTFGRDSSLWEAPTISMLKRRGPHPFFPDTRFIVKKMKPM